MNPSLLIDWSTGCALPDGVVNFKNKRTRGKKKQTAGQSIWYRLTQQQRLLASFIILYSFLESPSAAACSVSVAIRFGANDAVIVFHRQGNLTALLARWLRWAYDESWMKRAASHSFMPMCNAQTASDIRFPHLRMLMAISLLSPPINGSFWQIFLGLPSDMTKEAITHLSSEKPYQWPPSRLSLQTSLQSWWICIPT